MLDRLRKFFGPAYDSIKGYLNAVELAKSAVLGLVTGGTVLAVLLQIQANAGLIFPNPNDDALVSAVLAFLIDAARRLPQGRPSPLASTRCQDDT